MTMRLSLPLRLTAFQLNGLVVALGVACVQALLTMLLGADFGMAAVGGAVCASLPDVPNPPHRTWRRVWPAALLATLVTLAVGLMRHSPAAMTAVVAVIGLVTLMAMAWGPRAGPLSFAGTLAMVFAMAWDAPDDRLEALQHAGRVLSGAVLYMVWAQATAWLLRRRFRELAVIAALRAGAARLRSRAARVAGTLRPEDDTLRASIRDDAVFSDALQAARDQVFAARPSPHSRRLTDVVLRLIELRDGLLGSRLDLGLLGDDAPSQAWRQALAEALNPLAGVLDALADALVEDRPLPAWSAAPWQSALAANLAAVQAPADDPRRPLLTALQGRLGHLMDDVAAMSERLVGPDRPAVWSREQLQLFVSPEGWPLAALKPHLTLESGVMRHALRGTLAMTCAWLLGLALPWATHPHWLVLSVAVVLRGNLEQTLSRRNERVIGTVIGCLLVLALAHVGSHAVLAAAFIAAVGTAHAYVNVRYRVAATAATLMALLQPLLLAPGSGPAVGERLADTVIGAGLAWAFCFVLPSWERRTLVRQTHALTGALGRHAANVLQASPSQAQQLAQRLSRQQAYTALGALAAAAQRHSVEPETVQVPEWLIEALLSHGYREMALLGAVQQALARRAERLDLAALAPDLLATAKLCARASAQAVLGAPVGEAEPPPGPMTPTQDWPSQDATGDLTPWLRRRLRLTGEEARRLSEAAVALSQAAQPPRTAV
jgi:uncharacterized membrane protein YccC